MKTAEKNCQRSPLFSVFFKTNDIKQIRYFWTSIRFFGQGGSLFSDVGNRAEQQKRDHTARKQGACLRLCC